MTTKDFKALEKRADISLSPGLNLAYPSGMEIVVAFLAQEIDRAVAKERKRVLLEYRCDYCGRKDFVKDEE